MQFLRHIPKGGHIQTAQALTTIINDCISGDAGVLPWWKLLFFGCTAFPDTSGNDSSGPSLTTIVKCQVAAVAALWIFSPLLYNPIVLLQGLTHLRLTTQLCVAEWRPNSQMVMSLVQYALLVPMILWYLLMMRHYLVFNQNIHPLLLT